MLASTFWVIRFCIIVAWHTVALHLWTFGAEKREKDYIANGGRSGEQHGETIDTDADTASRRQSEGEGANVVFVHAVGLFVTTLTLAELRRLPDINAKGGFSAAESYAEYQELLQAEPAAFDPRVLVRILKGREQSAAVAA